jgi:UDP-glucose 4-epimerase
MDIVDALLRAGYFERAIGQEMNIASGQETNILKMAELINQLTGNEAGIMRAPPRKWDTKKRLLASIDRANELLGYEPRMEFERGLKITIQWFRDNWHEIRRDAEFPPGSSAAVSGMIGKRLDVRSVQTLQTEQEGFVPVAG